MTFIESILLGILQGFTEFLPVSSSGHLVLAEHILGYNDEVPLLYDILLHVASLLAVFIFFRKKLIKLVKGLFDMSGYNEDHKYAVMLIISTFVTGIMLFVTKPAVHYLRANPVLLFGTFLFTAGILFVSQYFLNRSFDKKEMTVKDAVIIGAFQGIAVLPGISRSGSTITAALFRKLSANDAVEYSFMLAIPAILGALVLESVKGSFSSIDPVTALAGFTASFLSSLVALRFLVFMIKKTIMYPFGIYLGVLAVIVVLVF
jgi:undecaprenyl-diphosphatase